jgi:hypothetical protein
MAQLLPPTQKFNHHTSGIDYNQLKTVKMEKKTSDMFLIPSLIKIG